LNFTRNHAGEEPAQNKEGQMAKLAKVAKLIGMEGAADDAAVKQALEAKMEEEAKAAMEGEEGYDYEGHAAHLEEMAKAYEEAHYEEEEEGEAPHVVMRKMAAKMRRMADPPFGGKETPEEEAAEEKLLKDKMEEEGEEAKMAKHEEDDEEKAKLEAKMAAMETRLARYEKAEAAREAADKAERERAFEALADQAVAGGYPKSARAALVKFARSDIEGARASVAHLLPKSAHPGYLMDRLTAGGSPIGSSHTARDGASVRDRKIVTMSALGNGAKAVVYGENLSRIVSEMADSVDPQVRARIDRDLPDGAKGSKFESMERYLAAERILKQDRADLFEAATEDDYQ
jgi:hypothetical protein